MVNISIITVTYNAANTLQRTLDSVGKQTCRSFEHLIIDGKSSDGTIEMATRYKKDNPDVNITILSERDKGLYDAMNKGLKMASGQFVCFLNAGDKLHSENSLTAINNIIEDGLQKGSVPAVVYGETDIVDDEGNFISLRRLKAPEELTWKSFKMGMLVCHQSFYANKDVVGDYDLTYRFSADFDWCVRAMKTAKEKQMPLVNCHQILTDYLSEGMTTQNHKASLKERFRIMKKHYGWLTTVCCHAWFFVRAIFK